MTQFASSSDIRTFRVASPVRALVPAMVACLAAFVIVAAVTPAEDRWIMLILGAVLLFSLALAAWLLTRTHLDVSSDGITYYAIGYRVHSTWANLKGYGKRQQRAASYESLILREPGIEVSRWLRIGYALMPVASIVSATQGEIFIPERLSNYADYIPVALFENDWRDGELGALVKRYAPQAFDNAVT